jgi:hypothetical protein
MNDMEINMITRLMKKYELVNLGQLVNYDFYHMEHYHPLVLRSSSTHRKVNPEHLYTQTDILHPNGPDWGLVKYPFEKLPYSRGANEIETVPLEWSPFKWLSFILLLLFTGAQIAGDMLVKPFITGYVIWMRRALVAWETVHGQPLVSWPRHLASLWVRKKREQRLQTHKPLQ